MAARTARQLRIAAARNALRADPWYQLLDEAIATRKARQRLRGSAYADEEYRVQGGAVAARLARRAAASAAILERYSANGATEAPAREGRA